MAAHCQSGSDLAHSSAKSSAIWISTECGIQSFVSVACTMTPLLVPGAFLKSRSRIKSSYTFPLQMASSFVAVRMPSVTLQTLSGKMALDRLLSNRGCHPLPDVWGWIYSGSWAADCRHQVERRSRQLSLIFCICVIYWI